MQKSLKKILSAVLTMVMLLSLCAPVFTVSAADELTTKVEKWNLALGDEIAVNFYVSVSDAVSEDAVIVVTDGYGPQEYPLSAAETDASGNYKFTARLAAAQLADAITLQLHDGENVGTVHTYTAVDYAQAVMNGNYGDSTKALVKSMLNYGAMAQKYFNYNTENLANAGYESTESVEIPAVDTANMVSGKVSGVSFYGASLVFQSKVAVRFYFKVTGNIADYTFSTGTPVAKDGMYYIEVADINPQDYDTAVKLMVNDTMIVSYSPLTYISRKAGSDNAQLAALVKAMYTYYLTAEEYVSAENDVVQDPSTIRGLTVEPNTDHTIELPTGNITSMSLDYKVVKGEKINLVLASDWSNYYGYFALYANGQVSANGVTTEALADGYTRVTFDLAALTDIVGTPSNALSFIYIRGDWTDANGYIDNLTFEREEESQLRGDALSAESYSVSTKEGKYEAVSFDYKLTSAGTFTVALKDSTGNSLASYRFDDAGSVATYSGVKTGLRADGYISVTIDCSGLGKIAQLCVDGNAEGYIDNVLFRESAQPSQLRVGVVSDTHIEPAENGDRQKVRFIKLLNTYKQKGVDAIIVAGDLQGPMDTGTDLEMRCIEIFADAWFEVFPNGINDLTGEYVEPILVYGNHDITLIREKYWPERFGSYEESFLKEINGYYFVGTHYGQELTADPYVQIAKEESGNYPFFYIQHAPVIGTLYSDSAEGCWGAMAAPESLMNSTNAVVFTGHTHFDIKNEKSIWQPTYTTGAQFTAVNTGTLYDMQGYYMVVDGTQITLDRFHINETSGAVSAIGETWSFDAADPTDRPYRYEIEQEEEEKENVEIVVEGGSFVSGQDFTIDFQEDAYDFISFDYKITSGEYFNFALLSADWQKHYSYFELNGTVNSASYDGVTYEQLDNGYIRVTMEIAKLTKIGSASAPEKLGVLYVRGGWSNASGVIENVRCVIGTLSQEPIVAGEDGQIDFAEEDYDFVSFEYELTSDGEMAFGFLKSDWSKYYGLFKVNANGTAQDYEGITTEKLSDGKIRVTLDLSKVQITNNAGNRDNVPETIGILYIRGDWTTASGMIYNLRFWYGEAGGEGDENYTEIVVPGGSVAANEDFTVNFESGAYDAVTFDYQITNGGELQICLLQSDWAKYYGYFKFNADGTVQNYDGVSTEKLSNGYVRATLKLAELGITNWEDNRDNAPETISILYVRGAISNAAGTIDNIRCITGDNSEEPSDPAYRGQEIVVGQDLSIMAEQAANYSQVVLDMIVPAEGGENEIGIALLDANWNYYGYFYLEKTGLENPYAGVSAEKLPDGYWRITINVDEIDGSRTHGDVGDIERVYIHNHTTGGYIDNVQFVQAAPEPDEPEVTYDIATGLAIDVEDGTYDYVTFDYKVTNDGVLYIAALSSDWSKYYGYYEFDADGKVWEDQGVYCEKLDDGFFQVTLKIAELNRTNNVANLNNKPDHIGLLYVGGSNTATGIIRNVKYGAEASTEPETPEVPDAVNVSYNFSGNEASRAGYAEGTVTVSGNLVSGRVYHFCWANAEGKLEMYRPLGSVTVAAGQSSVSLTIGENVAIAAGADRIAVYQNNGVEWAGFAMLENKVNAGQLKVKYAVVSDVHTNYNQGEKYWLNALKQFQAEGVEYIIVSGDIGESNADYAKYISAVETSGFSGVIMACIGNHDQTTTGSINFKNYAIYDGSSKTWVAIDDAPAYFANQYAGDLDISVSIDGSNKAYYFATIGDNAFMFMDQELGPDGGTTTQDNFSQQQLNFVENNLYAYSATHNLHIVEHAPIEQLKVGDKFIPGYGGCIQLSLTYPNNQRFLNLLMEYTEAIWLSGHTHVQYDAGIMYVDKYYDASGNLTDTPIAHSVHVSSLAQPRWYEESGMIMKNDYTAASQGYVCYQYENDVVYEARVFKNYTPDSVNYDESLFINEVEAINSLMIPLEKVSHDAPEVIKDLAVAENGYVRQGTVSYEDTADGLKITFAAANNRFEIRTGNQTKGYYHDYYVQFKIKGDLTAISLGGCNYNAGRRTEVIVDLTASGTNYTVTDLGDGWKFVQIPFTVLGYEEYLSEFAIRFYNTNAAGTFYLKELFISPFDYSHMRGDTFIGGVNKTVNTPVPVSDVLSFEYRIIAGSQMYVALLHDWSNYFGYYYFNANGEVQDYAGITTEVLSDGYVQVTCDVNLLNSIHGTPSAISMIYISKNNGDASGYIDNIHFEVSDSDDGEAETAIDYAVAINGVKRQGSPTWEDTADGLKVTFAAASDRFEIKTGNQTAAANGTLQFKIKTDLTSITLGGCNYSGLRKSTVSVNLTASGSDYTVTDLGDGWMLVEVPMRVIGVADYIAEFAIRFYNTNAAGTFILKDMNFVA